MSTAEEVVRSFVERINEKDVGGIGELMSEDHLFVDSGGRRHEGAQLMRPAWESYFGIFPDYRIEPDVVVAQGENVAIFGSARATHAPSGEGWESPAAWLAVARNDRVAEWRVYCDLGFGPLRSILERAASE